MEERSDAELVALARAGDKDAFGQLIERYAQMAHRVALGRIADPEVARQLSQEAMLQAYLSLGSLRADDRFRSWLYGIVLNVCRSYLRGQKGLLISLEALEGSPQVETDRLVSLNPSPQAVVEEHELQREVLDAIQGLPPKSQAAAYLFYYEGLSVREIADTLGASASAVKGRLYRARQQLRDPLWSVYVARASVERRRRSTMATEPSYREVMIADVIERGDRQEPVHVLVLLDKVGRRILPLWISHVEGTAILLRLFERDVPRPLTHDLMSSLLQAVGVTVEEVRVEALREGCFYAVVKLHNGDTEQEIDARPSDAIALALRTGCPIYAAEQVLEEAGIPIPESAGEMPKPGRGMTQILQRWKEKSQDHGAFDFSHFRRRNAEKAKPPPRPTKEEIEKRQKAAQQHLIDFLYGEEP